MSLANKHPCILKSPLMCFLLTGRIPCCQRWQELWRTAGLLLQRICVFLPRPAVYTHIMIIHMVIRLFDYRPLTDSNKLKTTRNMYKTTRNMYSLIQKSNQWMRLDWHSYHCFGVWVARPWSWIQLVMGFFQPFLVLTQGCDCYGPTGKAGTTQPVKFVHFIDESLRVLLYWPLVRTQIALPKCRKQHHVSCEFKLTV